MDFDKTGVRAATQMMAATMPTPTLWAKSPETSTTWLKSPKPYASFFSGSALGLSPSLMSGNKFVLKTTRGQSCPIETLATIVAGMEEADQRPGCIQFEA